MFNLCSPQSVLYSPLHGHHVPSHWMHFSLNSERRLLHLFSPSNFSAPSTGMLQANTFLRCGGNDSWSLNAFNVPTMPSVCFLLHIGSIPCRSTTSSSCANKPFFANWQSKCGLYTLVGLKQVLIRCCCRFGQILFVFVLVDDKRKWRKTQAAPRLTALQERKLSSLSRHQSDSPQHRNLPHLASLLVFEIRLCPHHDLDGARSMDYTSNP